jgi:heterodisulfide reductase subunit A-like polyferredoxin
LGRFSFKGSLLGIDRKGLVLHNMGVCGICAEFCQFAAISAEDRFARIDAAACMGCGIRVAHCPQEAISLQREPAKGEPL